MRRALERTVASFLGLSTMLILGGEAEASRTILVRTLPITASQEVPVNGSLNTGSAEVRIDLSARTLTYSISHNVVGENAAHIHGPAVRGVNAGVKHTLPLGSPKFGTYAFPASDSADIVNGRFYINIHSVGFPNGEIRGQIDSLVTIVQPDYDRFINASDIAIQEKGTTDSVSGTVYLFRSSNTPRNLNTTVRLRVNGVQRALSTFSGSGSGFNQCYGMCNGKTGEWGVGCSGLFCGCPFSSHGGSYLRDCADSFFWELAAGAINPGDVVTVELLAAAGSDPELFLSNDTASVVAPRSVPGLGSMGAIALALLLTASAVGMLFRNRGLARS